MRTNLLRRLVSFFAPFALMLLVVVLSGASFAADGDKDSKPIELRVLYAGKPDSARMKDFAALLEKHFTKVATSNYEAFKPEEAKDFDVVILDWPSIYNRDENGKIVHDDKNMLTQPQPPKLDQSFTKPTVLIGSIAGTMGRQLQLAIDWKCLCLESVAHDLVESHAIFHEPLAVDLQLVEKEKPLDYYLHPGTEKLGESMRVWEVQTKTFPEIDPGLVSSRENFTKTPDAEVISGGFNGKGPTSVAIGRHGNYLQWGFSGQPSEMTESARNAFVNAVCYIHKFDGHAPTPVKSTFGDRNSFVERVYFLRSGSDDYLNKLVEEFKRRIQETPLPPEQMKQLGDDPAAYFRKMYVGFADEVRKSIPQSVRDECHDDPEQLIKYYRDNLEYLRKGGMGGLSYEVDEDAKKLGVSNRSTDILEKCVAMLEKGDDPETARRVLERYTTLSIKKPKGWRAWLNKERDSLRYDEFEGKFQ